MYDADEDARAPDDPEPRPSRKRKRSDSLDDAGEPGWRKDWTLLQTARGIELPEDGTSVLVQSSGYMRGRWVHRLIWVWKAGREFSVEVARGRAPNAVNCMPHLS